MTWTIVIIIVLCLAAMILDTLLRRAPILHTCSRCGRQWFSRNETSKCPKCEIKIR